jgi:ubiquinone biosynthesis protein UbiJ
MNKRIRIRKVGSVEDAQRELWRSIMRVREVLNDPLADPERTLKAAHAMQQCVSAYVRLVETKDLEARVTELETAAARGVRRVA